MGLFDATELTMKFQGKTYAIADLNAYFKKMNYSVSGSGAVYKRSVGENDELGLIPSYLEFLFKERKKVKKEMLKAYHDGMVLKKFKQACIADGLYKEK